MENRLGREAEISRRLDEISLRGGNEANCIGTSLFLAGVSGGDGFIDCDIERQKIYLEKLLEVDHPSVGCLVFWRGISHTGELQNYHAAVVTSTSPEVRVAYRNGHRGLLMTNIPLSEAIELYNSPMFREEFLGVKYFLPQKD